MSNEDDGIEVRLRVWCRTFTLPAGTWRIGNEPHQVITVPDGETWHCTQWPSGELKEVVITTNSEGQQQAPKQEEP